MKRTYKDYVLDIVEAMKEVHDFTKGMTRSEFGADKKTINAVIRSLEVMGEAAKRIPLEMRKSN